MGAGIPPAPLKHTVYFKLGNYYADKGRFKEALEVYEKVKPERLPVADRAAFLFRNGYAGMQNGEINKAMALFLDTEQAPGKRYL